jgi:protease-4
MRTRRAPLAVALLALAGTGCVQLDLFATTRGELVETRLSGPSRAPKVLLLDVQGTIREAEEETSWLSPPEEGTAARVREQLDRARADGDVKALLLRVDTPGGSATASDLVFQEIRRFKEERRVPVVAQFMSLATSGGYYLSMAADEVRALPTSVTGSIGVIFVGVNLAGLMEKLGIDDQTIVSGPYKDAGSPLRRMRPGEREQLQSIIDDLQSRFVAVVDEGRPALDEARVRELADGRIYSAPQALEAGLIDAIGSLDDAVARARELAGLEKAQVVTYHRQREWRSNVYTRGPAAPELRLDLGSLLGLDPPRPGFHYLWWPVTR